MDSVVRALIVYLFLLVVFRLSGKRSLAEVTPFDAVLLLIISEAIQQALIDNDNSLTNALVIVVTLVGIDVALSLLKQHSRKANQILDGSPVIIVENGELHHERMSKERVDANDVLEAARSSHGLERMNQVKHAVLEANGNITVVPAK
ncbi:MAG TPA: YetF domain-containing protein [Gemmatimonadaceae bacterium]|nr:YetF domain-containing protein [Gemmatimonadaceae bacterium]